MGELLKNYDVWGAIWTTIQLAVLSAIGATVIGTIVAIMRVSPVAVLRGLGTSYVNIFRNTPLTVLLVMSVLGLAFILGLSFSDDFARNAYWWAVAMLSLYHAAFICEALRSGINTVPAGQAEAARSIGLTFSQSLSPRPTTSGQTTRRGWPRAAARASRARASTSKSRPWRDRPCTHTTRCAAAASPHCQQAMRWPPLASGQETWCRTGSVMAAGRSAGAPAATAGAGSQSW